MSLNRGFGGWFDADGLCGGLFIDEDESLKKLYPYISKSSEIEEMVQQLYKKRTDKSVHIDKKGLKRWWRALIKIKTVQ